MGKTGIKHGGHYALRMLKQGKLDRRCRLTKQLEAIEANLVEDAGGVQVLSQGQLILLDRILEKLIFLQLISQYALGEKSIITEQGELIPCLGKNFLAYSNSLRLDLVSFYELSSKKPTRNPTLEDYLTKMKKVE